MQKSSLKIESLDTSKNASQAQRPISEQEQDAPPRGSALNIETALTFARKIKHTEHIETAWMYVDTVVEQLEEVAAKIKRQRQLSDS